MHRIIALPGHSMVVLGLSLGFLPPAPGVPALAAHDKGRQRNIVKYGDSREHERLKNEKETMVILTADTIP